jgi:CheY-like chemotaxis protein
MKNEMALNQIWPAAPNRARTRWMVVDDNDGVLELVACIITAISGDRVSCFRSGAEALEAFAAAPERFQFVITDLEMPGMSGIELCRKLVALSPRLKSLLVTGSGIITREEARRFGFCDLLSKPFAPSALRQVLRAAGVLPNDPATNKTGWRPDHSSERAAVCVAA